MISVKLLGRTEVTHALDAWAGEVRVPRRLLTDLASDVVALDIAEKFSSQGPGWKPLSPAYASWKAEHFPGRPILVRKGTMREELLTITKGGTSRVSGNTLDITPRTPYFGVHQRGGKHIPKRQMIDLQALEPKSHAYIEHWLTGRARDFGLVRAP